MAKRILALVAALAVGSQAQAQLFSGGATFTVAPTSQLGPVTNNLIITNTPTGFIISGQALITVPAGPVSGVLLAFTVDRPLNPLYGTNTLTTTTVLDGFSLPPLGVSGNTAGLVTSVFTNPGIGSQSLIPMTLVGGVDLPPWLSITATSPSFLYTSGGVATMQTRFQLDGNYIAGPGGTWTIDLPLIALFDPVPEPATILLPVVLVGVWGYSRRRKSPA